LCQLRRTPLLIIGGNQGFFPRGWFCYRISRLLRTFTGLAKDKMKSNEQTLDDDCVLIAGGGPIGMLVAIVLAHYGVKSLVLERNETTTESANQNEMLKCH
jgi:heterodisulfide reductase subunit A-like polyferredoxin